MTVLSEAFWRTTLSRAVKCRFLKSLLTLIVAGLMLSKENPDSSSIMIDASKAETIF